MPKHAVDDLSIILSASSEQLAGDLRAAAKLVEGFGKTINRAGSDIGFAKAFTTDLASIKSAARSGGVAAAREFARGASSVSRAASAASAPFRAMMSSGRGAALADPFLLATSAVDSLAALIPAPFHLAAAGAKLAGGVISAVFKTAGAAVDGLGSVVGGLAPVFGGVFGGIGKVAGGVLAGIGSLAGTVFGAIGTGLGALGEAGGKVFAAVGRAAVAGLALTLNFGREAVGLAAEAEKTRIAFDVLTGSAAKAEAVLSGLRRFAAETPFGLKEVTEGAKQLAGYGTASGQLVPTIRMLGDVSSATGKPLGELVYLYGTLLNQDRAYLVDIKQFATAGIPIYEELGKVLGKSTDQMRQMVEEGKVGIPQVQRAFLNMTSAGGRFHGLMARQADSMAGVLEQLTDAWDRAKMKFGQVLIEELGLKEATRDAQAFVQGLESAIDRLRPAVHFFGELARGVANFGVEAGKAFAALSDVNARGFDALFPGLGQAVREFRDAVKDAKNFRLDPEQVANFSINLFEQLASPVAAFVDYAQAEGAVFAAAFKRDYIDPVLELVNTLNRAVNTMKLVKDIGVGLVRGGDRIPTPTVPLAGGGPPASYDRAAVGDALAHMERFAPLSRAPATTLGAERYRELQGVIDKASGLGDRRALDVLLPARRTFLAALTDDVERDFAKLHAGLMGGAQSEPTAADRVRGIAQSLRDSLLPSIRAAKEQQANQKALELSALGLRTSFGLLYGPAAFAGEALRKLGDEVFKVKDQAMPEVMDVARKAREGFEKTGAFKLGEESKFLQEAGRRGLFGLSGGIDPGTFGRAANDLGRRAREMAGVDGFPNPEGLKNEIAAKRSELAALRQAGLISPLQESFAMRAFAGRKADEMGAGRLPDAAMKDTTESVRILNQWAAGTQRQSTEALLKMLVETEVAQLRLLERQYATAPVLGFDVPLPR